MKFSIPTSKGWYVAVILLFAPMVTIWAIEPNWLGRFIGLGFWFVLAPLLILWSALDPRVHFFREDAFLYKKFDKKRVEKVARIIVFVVGVLSSIFLVVPFSRDSIFLFSKNPLTRTSLITDISGIGRGLIIEHIVLEKEVSTKDNSFTAWYFPPRHIMQGNTYEFLYLPHTRIILEARLIENSDAN